MHSFKNKLSAFSIFILPVTFYCQVVKFSVQDSLTKKPLPYASIDFLNGNGAFSNENGIVSVDDPTIKKVEISYVGYESRIVGTNKISDAVLLKSKATELKEIAVKPQQKHKTKEFRVKPQMHEDYSNCFVPFFSEQIAFQIPGNPDNRFLKSISIPISKKAWSSMYGQGKIIPFKTVIRIDILKSKDNQPGEPIEGFSQIAIIDSEAIGNKFELDLNDLVPIPENGCFAAITILGKADKDNKMIVEMPYDLKNSQKFVKIIQPAFPIVESPKGTLTYFRILHATSKEWYSINHPSFYQKENKYPNYNIAFGYTTTQ